MAKKKTKAEEAMNLSAVDDVFAGWAADQREKGVGPAVLTGGESSAKLVGLYLPHLVLRYFLQSNVLPLGRNIQLAGEPATGKSTLLYWFYRLFRINSGRIEHIENEDKDNEPRRLAMLNYDYNACNVTWSTCVEDWQDSVTRLLSPVGQKLKGGGYLPSIKERMEAAGLKGKVPVCIGLDGLTSKASRDQVKAVMELGHATKDRSQQDNAQLISKWLKAIPQQFSDWPFCFIATNQLKPGQEQLPSGMLMRTENVGGGFSVKFQETFRIYQYAGKRKDLLSNRSISYRLKTDKNSIGADKLGIEVDCTSWIERNKESPFYGKDRVRFEWDAASIELIFGRNGYDFENKKTLLKEMQDLTGLRDLNNGRCYSDLLGVPKDDPVTYDEMGKLLERAPDDVLDELHMMLGVHKHRVFEPSIPFQDQLQEAANSAAVPPAVPPDDEDGALPLGG